MIIFSEGIISLKPLLHSNYFQPPVQNRFYTRRQGRLAEHGADYSISQFFTL